MSLPPKPLLCLERFDSEALQVLRTEPGIEFLDFSKLSNSTQSHNLTWSHVPQEWADRTAILVIRSRTKVSTDLLRRFPRLELVVTCTSGFDHIDLEACANRGIQCAYTPEGNVTAAAELTWALVLSTSRKLRQLFQAVEKNRWDREPLQGSELAGQSLGIIGLGRIGTQVAKYAQAFQMEILAYDPYADEKQFNTCGAQRLGFEELLRSANMITLHVPHTKETHHMINRQCLELMTDETILINASRGSVVDEQALAAVLQEGLILGAGLDVFEREPLDLDSRLLRSDRVVLTPHCGGLTTQALRKVSFEAVSAVRRFLSGEEIPGLLPPRADWYRDPKGYNS